MSYSAAYEEGVSDKRRGEPEPEPVYIPGSEEYKGFADGYLSEPFQHTIIFNTDHNIGF